MGNWSNYKLVLAVILPLLLSLESKHEQHARWGFFGHKKINRIAVFTLPPEMFGFFRDHIEFLTEHAVDPDKRRYAVEGEAQCHYIDLDHYYKTGENPFEIIPRKWKDAAAKFSEDTLQAYGIVPWHISIMKMRLQKAFETKNVDLILKYAAEIGHYIGDAHVPLHTTENYNGQLTNQKGIHGLWESRLVEINAENYDFFVGKSIYVQSVSNMSWEAVEKSHRLLDSVLQIERELTTEFPTDKKYSFEQRGNVTLSVYSYEFSQEYHKRMNKMVERRMRSAVLCVGSVWYTAWVDAGQPDLNTLRDIPLSSDFLEELKILDQPSAQKFNGGSICD